MIVMDFDSSATCSESSVLRDDLTLLRAGFAKTFEPHLGKSKRWSAFQFIADILIARSFNQPTIMVETGCARQAGNWNGDDESTVVWSWLAGQCDGFLYSVDINPENIETARSIAPSARITVGDSVNYLRDFHDAPSISLLYLRRLRLQGGRPCLRRASPARTASDLRPASLLTA